MSLTNLKFAKAAVTAGSQKMKKCTAKAIILRIFVYSVTS
jgi:hypothetical protein